MYGGLEIPVYVLVTDFFVSLLDSSEENIDNTERYLRLLSVFNYRYLRISFRLGGWGGGEREKHR